MYVHCSNCEWNPLPHFYTSEKTQRPTFQWHAFKTHTKYRKIDHRIVRSKPVRLKTHRCVSKRTPLTNSPLTPKNPRPKHEGRSCPNRKIQDFCWSAINRWVFVLNLEQLVCPSVSLRTKWNRGVWSPTYKWISGGNLPENAPPQSASSPPLFDRRRCLSDPPQNINSSRFWKLNLSTSFNNQGSIYAAEDMNT